MAHTGGTGKGTSPNRVGIRPGDMEIQVEAEAQHMGFQQPTEPLIERLKGRHLLVRLAY